MQNSFCSIKVCAYVCLFACLFNLATNDEEGYFYIKHNGTGKSWNITWNSNANGQKMAEFIKSQKGNQIALLFEYYSIFQMRAYKYDNNKDKVFDFNSFGGAESTANRYDIIACDNRYIFFVIRNDDNGFQGKILGQFIIDHKDSRMGG